MREFRDYEEFFAYYVSRHSRPQTRWLHFAGAHVGALAASAALIWRRPLGIVAFPAIACGLAWCSHLAVERNRPPATADHPLWSLRGELQMIAMMWQGRDGELTRIARDERTIVIDPERASAP